MSSCYVSRTASSVLDVDAARATGTNSARFSCKSRVMIIPSPAASIAAVDSQLFLVEQNTIVDFGAISRTFEILAFRVMREIDGRTGTLSERTES